MNSRLHHGTVWHARLHPVKHPFQLPVTFYAFDLAELEALDRGVKGFGWNRRAPVSLRARDFLTPGEAHPREKLAPWLAEIGGDWTPGRITLVTAARWLGYVFNPVSFYLIDDAYGALRGLVAEVNNTFGDRHVYAVPLSPAEEGPLHEGKHAKEFHVSPFNDLSGRYRFTVRRDAVSLYIGVDLFRDGRKILETWIEGAGVPLDSRNVRREMLRHPLRPWLTMPRIVWQAIFLRFQHHLPVFKRPEPRHPNSLRSRGKARVA